MKGRKYRFTDGEWTDNGSADVSVKIVVADQDNNDTGYDVTLEPYWCECEASEFLCYPEDGDCECSLYKHHVHCTCGNISQVG